MPAMTHIICTMWNDEAVRAILSECLASTKGTTSVTSKHATCLKRSRCTGSWSHFEILYEQER